MEWHDRHRAGGAAARRERACSLHVLTAEHGRHAGLVRGGQGARERGAYVSRQPARPDAGAARLSEHLGTIRAELRHESTRRASSTTAPRLAALASAAALADAALPEREPHPRAFRGLLDADRRARAPIVGWAERYVRLGDGPSRRTGLRSRPRAAAPPPARNDDLIYVSPRSGQAVSASGRRALSRQAAASCRRSCDRRCAAVRPGDVARRAGADRLLPRAPRLRAAWPASCRRRGRALLTRCSRMATISGKVSA